MYRRPKFLEILLEIRREMALEVDYDVDLFAEMTRSGNLSPKAKKYRLDAPTADVSLNGRAGTKTKRSRGA